MGGEAAPAKGVFSSAETLYAFAMPLDSPELEAFYESRMGQVARRLISRRLREQWPDLSGQRLLGFGYASTESSCSCCVTTSCAFE